MEKKEVNGYTLSRKWFDFCFENPEKIKPNHTALYFFAIEHCNRLGWKSKFGLPTTMVMEAIGIKSYNTYINTLTDLVDFGFVSLIEKSKNQYSANIIALSNFNKALDKALDKAFIKHTTKQSESTSESIDSIDKQVTINNKQYTITDIKKEVETLTALMNVLNINKLKLSNYFNEFSIQYLTDKFTHEEYKDKLTHFINYVKKQEKDEQKENEPERGINGKYLGQAPTPLN